MIILVLSAAARTPATLVVACVRVRGIGRQELRHLMAREQSFRVHEEHKWSYHAHQTVCFILEFSTQLLH